MASRVKDKLAALMPMVSGPSTFVPLEVQTEADALEVLSQLDDVPEDTQERLGAAKAAVEEQGITFKFKHVMDGRHQEIRDVLSREKLKLLKDKVYRDVIREQILLSLESEPEDIWIDLYLASVGKGDSYVSDELLKTPRAMLQAAVDRIGEEFLPAIKRFGTEGSVALCDDLMSSLGLDADEVQYDDYEQDFIVHLTEQERAEIADVDEDSPEYEQRVRELRDAAFGRHLSMELERRKQEVEKVKAECLQLGKERVINRIVNAAVDARVDEALKEMYVAELIAESALIEDDDGKWVKAFDDRSDVETIKSSRMDLYLFLCEKVGERLPRSAQSLVMSSPFRTGVV